MKKIALIITVCLILVLFGSAFAIEDSSNEFETEGLTDDEPTYTPKMTPMSTPTITPVPSPTSAPTPTPTATPTLTPTSTVTAGPTTEAEPMIATTQAPADTASEGGKTETTMPPAEEQKGETASDQPNNGMDDTSHRAGEKQGGNTFVYAVVAVMIIAGAAVGLILKRKK